jgi:hypothetical protein
MTTPFRHLVVVTLLWLVGFGLAALLLLMLGPQGQCAVDPACAREAARWWHTPLLLVAGLGPGLLATVLWLRSREPAV